MTFRFALLSLLGLLGLGSHGEARPLPTVRGVDLKRYSGKWFEIARLPNAFQKQNERAIAEYLPSVDGSVVVRNTGISDDGKTRVAIGRATVVPGSEGARLRVKFSGLAGLVPASKDGNYWIIALDADYRSAMIGTPDRKFLWILSRDPVLDPPTVKEYVAKASLLGFSTEGLKWDLGNH